MSVFMAVWKDRHTDDWIELFKGETQAQEWIDERKDSYEDRFSDGSTYKWVDSKNPKPEEAEILKWFGYVWESDRLRMIVTEEEEGPSGYIEQKEISNER
jgi:hypothetical protein